MADIISKEAYQYLKGLPPEELDDTDREKMNDYERAEVNAPSNDDVKWATHIHNAVTSNPHTHGYDKEEVDWANNILAQESRYFHLKGGRAKDVYVQPVKRIPDNLIEDNDFKFNWKSAYENTKGEKLRDTEADYDKLQKFIDSNMFELNDPDVDLQKIAYNFHMYDPSKIPSELKTAEEIDSYFKDPWGYFINSDQGKEFQKYLEDVRENQRKNAINDIFDNESNFAVDFAYPVTKEYARNALLKGKNPEMAGPLLTDLAANAAMFVGGKPGLVAAPVISNIGQAAYNDVEPEVAAVNSLLGVGTNAVTPFMMSRGGRYFKTPGAKYSQKVAVQDRTNTLAREVADTEKKLNEGALHTLFVRDGDGRKAIGYINEPKGIVYTDTKQLPKGFEGYTVKPKAEASKHKAGIITDAEYDTYWGNADIARNNWLDIDLRHPVDEFKGARAVSQEREARRKKYFDAIHNPVYVTNSAGKRVKKPTFMPDAEKLLRDIANGKKVSELNMRELYALGYNPRESVLSFLWRIAPESAKNYFTNYMGRTVPAGMTMRIPNMLFGTDLNKFAKDKKDEKPKISDIFGE